MQREKPAQDYIEKAQIACGLERRNVVGAGGCYSLATPREIFQDRVKGVVEMPGMAVLCDRLLQFSRGDEDIRFNRLLHTLQSYSEFLPYLRERLCGQQVSFPLFGNPKNMSLWTIENGEDVITFEHGMLWVMAAEKQRIQPFPLFIVLRHLVNNPFRT